MFDGLQVGELKDFRVFVDLDEDVLGPELPEQVLVGDVCNLIKLIVVSDSQQILLAIIYQQFEVLYLYLGGFDEDGNAVSVELVLEAVPVVVDHSHAVLLEEAAIGEGALLFCLGHG